MIADRGLAKEIEAVLPSLREEAIRPAGEEGVKKIIGRRFALFIQPERSDGEWAEWWNDYVATLGHLPGASLEAAIQAHIAKPDARFLPTPGELLAIAKQTPFPAAKRYQHVRGAMEAFTQRVTQSGRTVRVDLDALPKPREMPTEGERTAVRNMLAGYIARDDERRDRIAASRPVLRPIQAPVDESGISDELREIMWAREL